MPLSRRAGHSIFAVHAVGRGVKWGLSGAEGAGGNRKTRKRKDGAGRLRALSAHASAGGRGWKRALPGMARGANQGWECCFARPAGQGRLFLFGDAAAGILVIASTQRVAGRPRRKGGRGLAVRTRLCAVFCAVSGCVRHTGVQPDADGHKPRLGGQRLGAKRGFLRLAKAAATCSTVISPALPARRQSPGRCILWKGQLPRAVQRGGQQPSGPIFTAASSACSRFCCLPRKRPWQTPGRPQTPAARAICSQAAALLPCFIAPHLVGYLDADGVGKSGGGRV